MKILILGAPFGDGHVRSAENIQKILEEKGHEVVYRDPYIESLPLLTEFIKKQFLKAFTNRLNRVVYNMYYRVGDKISIHDNNIILLYGSRKGYQIIREINPDVVILTFPMHFIRSPKKPIMTVITDYKPNRFWISNHYTHYFVGSEYTKEVLENFHIDSKNISVTGIPVQREVQHSFVPEFQNEYPTVLYSGGARGVVNISLIEELISNNEQTNFILICGKNKDLYDAASVLASERVYVLGYVNNMLELLQNSDVVVTKAGGLSVAEAVFTKTPILINKDASVGSQEYGNIEFVTTQGIGTSASEKNLSIALRELLVHDMEVYIKNLERLYTELNIQDILSISSIPERGIQTVKEQRLLRKEKIKREKEKKRSKEKALKYGLKRPPKAIQVAKQAQKKKQLRIRRSKTEK